MAASRRASTTAASDISRVARKYAPKVASALSGTEMGRVGALTTTGGVGSAAATGTGAGSDAGSGLLTGMLATKSFKTSSAVVGLASDAAATQSDSGAGGAIFAVLARTMLNRVLGAATKPTGRASVACNARNCAAKPCV